MSGGSVRCDALVATYMNFRVATWQLLGSLASFASFAVNPYEIVSALYRAMSPVRTAWRYMRRKNHAATSR